MKKKIIIIVSWLLVLMWMGLIYYFSNMNGTESTGKSIKTIETTIKKTVEVTNEVGITNKNPDSKKVKEIAEGLNFPFRKIVHVIEYFILNLLLINALYQSGVKNKLFLISFIISFIYACSDEFHQSFTERTSSLIDVLIDMVGIFLSILMIKLVKKIKHV